MSNDTWIIERRDENGKLVFDSPQPGMYFGMGAGRGMSNDAMAKVIFRHSKDAVLDGRFIHQWPAVIHPQFVARIKNW
jgi:hypothetical protein